MSLIIDFLILALRKPLLRVRDYVLHTRFYGFSVFNIWPLPTGS